MDAKGSCRSLYPHYGERYVGIRILTCSHDIVRLPAVGDGLVAARM